VGSVIQQMLLDAQAYGTGIVRIADDGSVTRIEPTEFFTMAKGKPKPKPRPKPRPTGY
jgi:hypothetical protein